MPATAQDAEILLKLYDLRRESEIRKARNWWFTGFWPDSADDFMKIAFAPGSQENAARRAGLTPTGQLVVIVARLHPEFADEGALGVLTSPPRGERDELVVMVLKDDRECETIHHDQVAFPFS